MGQLVSFQACHTVIPFALIVNLPDDIAILAVTGRLQI
jgi:hypothetical protein